VRGARSWPTLVSMEYETLCPYCGQRVVIEVEPNDGRDQSYVDECPVCDHPWTVHAVIQGADQCTVALEREDD
jgi:uncharacterized Zn finger protein (UPF0148 family)